MKVFKAIAWIALISFVVIQFFPTDRNESYTTPTTDFMLVNKVPTEIENQLKVSCYDCHSNNTVYPWYSKVQPAAWFLIDHIKEGKEEFVKCFTHTRRFEPSCNQPPYFDPFFSYN